MSKILLWLCVLSLVQAQPVCTGPIDLTPANMDSYSSCTTFLGLVTVNPLVSQLNLPAVTTINGNFSIKGTNISSLSLGLLSVSGVLIVQNNPLLSSISFSSLSSLNGLLSIRGNPSLSSAALVPLSTATGTLSVENNSALALLNVSGLQTMVGNVYLRTNRFQTLDLSSLKTVVGNLSIDRSSMLANLPLPLLENVTGNLNIEGNPVLASLTDLSGLLNVGALRLINNSALGSLAGLSNAHLGNLYLYELNALKNLSGLASFTAISTITVARARLLEDITALAGVTQVVSVVLRDLPLVTDISPLDSLTNVVSHFQLNNVGILAMTGFNSLVELASLAIAYCPFVDNITGFNSLTTVPRTLMISSNRQLRLVTGFDSITSVSTVIISSNLALINVTGFSNFNTTQRVEVYDNGLLDNVEFLHNVQTITDHLIIQQNSVENLAGLRSLVSIGGDFFFTNEPTQTVDFITSLREVKGAIVVKSNPLLVNIDAFAQLTGVQTVQILMNPSLITVSGFGSMTKADTVEIAYNDNLVNVSGFPNLDTLKRLRLNDNPMMQSFIGLKKLRNVTQELALSSLPSLTTLDGLVGLTVASHVFLSDLNISNTRELSHLSTLEFISIRRNTRLEEISGLCNVTNFQGFEVDKNPMLCCSATDLSLGRAQGPNILKGCLPDPCIGRAAMSCVCASGGRCYNDGICHDVLNNSYFCECPPYFAGRACQYAIPYLFGCSVTGASSVASCTVNLTNTDKEVSVFGIHIPPRLKPNIHDLYLQMDGVNISGMLRTSTNTSFTFVAPNSTTNKTHYSSLLVRNKLQPLEVSIEHKLLYYVDTQCESDDGTFVLRNDVCVKCPDGGFCSGDRVWPHKGWWSRNESMDPVRCAVAEACPGALGETEGYPVIILPDGPRLTAYCASGYQGEVCSQCWDNWARGTFGACFSCQDPVADSAEVVGVIITAIIVFAFLAFAVAILDEDKMATTATLVMGVQRALAMGQLGATNGYGGPGLQNFFTTVSFFNFDIQFVRPGCGAISRLSFDSVFWGTIGVALLGCVFLVIASAIRARFTSEATLREFGERDKSMRTDTMRDNSKSKSTPEVGMQESSRSTRPDDGPERSRVESSHREVIPPLNPRSREPTALSTDLEMGTYRSSGLRGPSGRSLVSVTRDEATETGGPAASPPPPPPPPPPSTSPDTQPSGDSSYVLSSTPPGSQETTEKTEATSKEHSKESKEGHKDSGDGKARSLRKHRIFTRQALFRRRTVHALIMIGSLIHFQLCLRCLQGLVCDARPTIIQGETEYFLRVEAGTPCYSGGHLATMFFIYVIILGYCFGFPVWCSYQVYKIKQKDEIVQSLAKTQRFGFLYRELKPQFYWFRSVTFSVNFLLALFAVAVSVGSPQTFLAALVFLGYGCIIGFLLPFQGLKNVVPALLAFVGLMINVVVLGLDSKKAQESFYKSYLFAFLLIALFAIVGCQLFLKCRKYRAQAQRQAQMPWEQQQQQLQQQQQQKKV